MATAQSMAAAAFLLTLGTGYPMLGYLRVLPFVAGLGVAGVVGIRSRSVRWPPRGRSRGVFESDRLVRRIEVDHGEASPSGSVVVGVVALFFARSNMSAPTDTNVSRFAPNHVTARAGETVTFVRATLAPCRTSSSWGPPLSSKRTRPRWPPGASARGGWPSGHARGHPVGLMDLDPATAWHTVEYGDTTIAFGAPACKKQFLSDPTAFLVA